MKRTKKVDTRETMLEFAIWTGVRPRSFLIVTVKRGGKVYLSNKYQQMWDIETEDTNIPGPEGEHKSQPGEREHSAIGV